MKKMKVKALRNFLNNNKTILVNDELDLDNNIANYLIENNYVKKLDKDEVIAEQTALDSPAFSYDSEKITNKVTPKKKTSKKK